MLPSILSKLFRHEHLTRAEAEAVMTQIMSGEASPVLVSAYLTAMRMKGETVAEIAGSAKAMKDHALQVRPNLAAGEWLIDSVGTGGDGSNSFNISTAAAFVIAGAGYKVAKHGNRSASSKCGSADVLEACGVSLALGPAEVAECVDEVGIGFMFAPRFHPAMKHAIGPRRELKQRTLFNLLGPLTNPANASHLLIGVFSPDWTDSMARVLGALGATAAMVVHGHGGMDELVTTGANKISHLKTDGTVESLEVDAIDLGLKRGTQDDFAGGEPAVNAKILRSILDGTATDQQIEVVLLNAAGAIACESGDLSDGLTKARAALDSGAALEKLNALAAKSAALVADAS